jgi:hypothetical protein
MDIVSDWPEESMPSPDTGELRAELSCARLHRAGHGRRPGLCRRAGHARRVRLGRSRGPGRPGRDPGAEPGPTPAETSHRWDDDALQGAPSRWTLPRPARIAALAEAHQVELTPDAGEDTVRAILEAWEIAARPARRGEAEADSGRRSSPRTPDSCPRRRTRSSTRHGCKIASWSPSPATSPATPNRPPRPVTSPPRGLARGPGAVPPVIHIVRRLYEPLPRPWRPGELEVELECDRCGCPSFGSLPATPETLDIVVRALRPGGDGDGWRPCPLMSGADCVGVGDLCGACWGELRGAPRRGGGDDDFTMETARALRWGSAKPAWPRDGPGRTDNRRYDAHGHAMKWCPRCQGFVQLDWFSPNAGRSDGLASSNCRRCMAAHKRGHRAGMSVARQELAAL